MTVTRSEKIAVCDTDVWYNIPGRRRTITAVAHDHFTLKTVSQTESSFVTNTRNKHKNKYRKANTGNTQYTSKEKQIKLVHSGVTKTGVTRGSN